MFTCKYSKLSFLVVLFCFLNIWFIPPEQYDAFVKFTHDQLMRRFGEQPASCECIFLLFNISVILAIAMVFASWG